MLGGIFAQAGINLINDIEDLPTLPSNHPHLEEVNKMVGRNTKVGIVCFIIASLIGLYLISVHLRNDQGWSLFFLIVVSGIISLSYNMGPLNFKHRGLAMVQVFLLMGIMMIQGAYLAMSGHFSAQVLLHSIPISILISLLLLSNELRDWESDKSKDVGTLTGAPEPEDLDLPHNETVLLTIDIQNTYLEVSDDPVMTGIFTDQCISSTVRSLADESFNVVVVEDCCAAGTDELHRKELEIINMIYCNVVTTDELVEMMAL
ncbi:hypothetical protein GQR58_025285 [Nymphon striatum]|nr:hypothetical protein GQR58_025285 [Nymphon striatum]